MREPPIIDHLDTGSKEHRDKAESVSSTNSLRKQTSRNAEDHIPTCKVLANMEAEHSGIRTSRSDW